MKKRLLGLTLACSMAVMSLAGCGGGSSEGDATTEAPAAAETTTAAAAGGETTAAPVQAAEGDTVLK